MNLRLMSPPTRWGICGAGNISNKFVIALQTLQHEHEVVAVAARDLSRAEAFGAKHSIDSFFGSYPELFALKNVDIVYVGVINSEHRLLVLGALSAGKHVLCEKPLGLNEKETHEMVELARSRNLFLMEAYWTKFFPVWQELQSKISDGDLGYVNFLSATFAYSGFRGAVLDSDLGGGIYMSIGCYLTLVATMIFREYPERIKVAGFQRSEGVDDTASIQLSYSGGRVAHLFYTGSLRVPSGAVIIGTMESVNILERFWCPDRYELGDQIHIFTLPSKEKFEKFPNPNSAGLVYQAQAVRQCLLQGKQECPEMSLDESLMLARLNDEIRRQLGVRYPQDD